MEAEQASVKEFVVAELAEVQERLGACYQRLIDVNPLSAEVPTVRELKRLQMDILPVMQAISRLRGLE